MNPDTLTFHVEIPRELLQAVLDALDCMFVNSKGIHTDNQREALDILNELYQDVDSELSTNPEA